MRVEPLAQALAILSFWSAGAQGLPAPQIPILELSPAFNRTISTELFYELEELSRIVDVSYCVGTSGIQKPFLCASRCQDFPDFELVRTWNTGPLLADSCGYIVVSHRPSNPRIILAFRGTYSVANTIIDLSTIPQEYIPYPGDDDANPSAPGGKFSSILNPIRNAKRVLEPTMAKCENCIVHAGFMTSWRNTRAEIMSDLEEAVAKHPGYQLTLVGHSLGGAVAALASLDFKARGWNPKVTTFGEPKVGNDGLMRYIDRAFQTEHDVETERMYRRVTHVDDPVPLLPLKEWGYRMHAGEVYISKAYSPPAMDDLKHCEGDEDPVCIAGADPRVRVDEDDVAEVVEAYHNLTSLWGEGRKALTMPSRYKIWQLFFAHRDYFWRLGVCLPGGDPLDWYKEYPRPGDEL